MKEWEVTPTFHLLAETQDEAYWLARQIFDATEVDYTFYAANIKPGLSQDTQSSEPTCILTGAEGENPDDCTTHDHEESLTEITESSENGLSAEAQSSESGLVPNWLKLYIETEIKFYAANELKGYVDEELDKLADGMTDDIKALQDDLETRITDLESDIDRLEDNQ